MKFFKLARQITESAIWDDGTPFDKAHAWLDLLIYVNWADGERIIGETPIKVKRGSQFTSDKFLANRWHWSRNRVRRFLDTLERSGMVTIKRTSVGTWVNVVNYSKYQDRRTSNGTGNGTSSGTSSGTQLKKNIEEYVEEYIGSASPVYVIPTLDEVRAYCRERNSLVDPEAFFDYYERSGWRLTRGGQMKNWKAALRSWERNINPTRKGEHPNQRRGYGSIKV